MQNEIGQSINKRYFEAYDILVANGTIKNKRTFCADHSIDRRNFDRLRAEPWREFPLHLLNLISREYGISPSWLILGRGNMFGRRIHTTKET